MFKETIAACTKHGGIGIYVIKYIFLCSTIRL